MDIDKKKCHKTVEIISLQTTRKVNNWKTEETLARTVVTLETEGINLVQSLTYMMMIDIDVLRLMSKGPNSLKKSWNEPKFQCATVSVGK
jgi:hypothetical protein